MCVCAGSLRVPSRVKYFVPWFRFFFLLLLSAGRLTVTSALSTIYEIGAHVWHCTYSRRFRRGLVDGPSVDTRSTKGKQNHVFLLVVFCRLYFVLLRSVVVVVGAVPGTFFVFCMF